MLDSEPGTSGDNSGGKETDTRSPFERTYRGLMRALYEGSIVPGQRLIAPDLMRQFDVGRGTIREVLHRLASSGVVSMVPHRGAQVRRLSRAEVADILDIVELLLGLAARGAARAIREGASGEVLKSLHTGLRQPSSLDGFAGFFQAREEYYRCIVRLSANIELQRLFPAPQVHIMRAQLRGFQNAADSMALSDYSELTEAILSADPERAEHAGRKHVGYTRARVASLPVEAFAREGL